MIRQGTLLRLITTLKRNFKVNSHGIHGIEHWSRVNQNGLFLYDNLTDDPEGRDVITLFAFIHDSQRLEDGRGDIDHGKRAADFVEETCVKVFDLSERQTK
jgi:uncharacterized protein